MSTPHEYSQEPFLKDHHEFQCNLIVFQQLTKMLPFCDKKTGKGFLHQLSLETSFMHCSTIYWNHKVNKSKVCTYLMSFYRNCWVWSSQCIIWEITEFLLNILASFFVQPLFHASNLNSWWHTDKNILSNFWWKLPI